MPAPPPLLLPSQCRKLRQGQAGSSTRRGEELAVFTRLELRSYGNEEAARLVGDRLVGCSKLSCRSLLLSHGCNSRRSNGEGLLIQWGHVMQGIAGHSAALLDIVQDGDLPRHGGGQAQHNAVVRLQSITSDIAMMDADPLDRDCRGVVDPFKD